MTESHAPSESN